LREVRALDHRRPVRNDVCLNRQEDTRKVRENREDTGKVKTEKMFVKDQDSNR